MTCFHKTINDHTIPVHDKANIFRKNRALWICSICNKQDFWKDGWLYFGNIECRKCGYAEIDTVVCGECVKKGINYDSLPNKDMDK